MIFSRLKNRYGFNSHLFKNFFKFIVFTLLVCVVVNVFVYQNMRSVTNEHIAHENYYETKRIADSAESIFRELDFILNYIWGNRYIQTYIVSPKPDQLIYDINSKIHEEISMFSVIYDYIDSIYIYSRAYDRVFTSEGDKPMDELSDINWVRVYSGLENGEFKAWLRKKDDVYPYVYTYMRKTSYNGQDGAVPKHWLRFPSCCALDWATRTSLFRWEKKSPTQKFM